MDTIDDDTASLLMKRAYDMAGTVRGVKVWLDGTRLKVNGFKQVSALIRVRLCARPTPR